MPRPPFVFRGLLVGALVTAVGCGEPTTPSPPPTPTSSSTSSTSSATPPAPTASAATGTTSSTVTSAAPSASSTAPPEGGRCKSAADCAPDEDCIEGLPLNGKCWKKGTPHPVCLTRGTRIATPGGEVAVEDLREGNLVWTMDHGARVARPIARVGRTRAPVDHRVRKIELADGRKVTASPGHPTCDEGRTTLGGISVGENIDGSPLVTATLVPYGDGETFDLLPGSDSGCYWAGGVLLGSTLSTSRGDAP